VTACSSDTVTPHKVAMISGGADSITTSHMPCWK
jgi:hypothetical protein